MALFDTDVLIYHLRGYKAARELLLQFRDERNFCSVITTGEILFGMREPEKTKTFQLLSGFDELIVDKDIIRLAYDVKINAKGFQLELNDCIIAATAITFGQTLVTKNKKHYPDKRLKLFIPEF